MSSICPYPGLRPFTEGESVYFKGRDTHIEQIIAQLEQKKFLMLTGASGDGKSSLVYAGVIPNARAGFFKAKYNNWIVADFRPERAPLHHLAVSLAKRLKSDPADTEKELSFGFSSLINLYKSSDYYLDQESDKWKNADEKEKKLIKRKASNLLILADQFEEFFTNPENYSKGITSRESQTVVNLLLETARMALEQDIPVYIICTMRSDYIGQCAAFRGLPEMIGFSQFFVPRLKRKEIHQVIEDPAILSGNRISNRLTEMLINEMSEGFDQLPVLQHTLNGLWNAADKGNEEMDLLQLAKLAGISPSYLPKEDKLKFDEWFATLPDFRKAYFTDFSLEQVLSSHSDILYKTAHEYYAKHKPDGEAISREDAQLIIKTAFQCLTKIDEGRAVRNRMTLQEITEVLNQPHLTTEIVSGVLNIFREQGNTFISPFITDDPGSVNLNPDTVLDITHESLIRNWDRLTDWANEEHENWLTFKDFEKQLQRWTRNEKEKGYLLPIGSLTYFENWYNTARPNKQWLARYDESEDTRAKKLAKAEQTLKDANQFIKQSARNLFFSRTILKYGARKITTLLGLFVLIVSCTYYYFDYRSKQNESVIQDLENRGYDLSLSDKVKVEEKAEFLVNYEHLNPGESENFLNELYDDSIAFDIANAAFSLNIDLTDSVKIKPKAYRYLGYMDGRLENFLNRQFSERSRVSEINFRRLNILARKCMFILNNNKKDTLAGKLLSKYSWLLDKSINSVLDSKPDSLPVAGTDFNQSMEIISLIAGSNKLVSLDKILAKISFYENPSVAKTFQKLYPRGKVTQNTLPGYTMDYNGGYYVLSLLYGAKGDFGKTQVCVDTIMSSEYFNDTFLPGFISIMSVLSVNNHFPSKEGMQLVTFIIDNKKPGLSEWNLLQLFFENTLLKEEKENTGLADVSYASRAKYCISSLQKSRILDFCWEHNKKELKSGDELNYALAIYYKLKGLLEEDSGNTAEMLSFYQKAVKNYLSVSASYLGSRIEFYTDVGSTRTIPRSYYFMNQVRSFLGPDNYYNCTPSFQRYMLEHDPAKLYQDGRDADAYFAFLKMYYMANRLEPNAATKFGRQLDYSYFEAALKIGEGSPGFKEAMDNEYLDLVFINKAFEEKDTLKALAMYNKLDLKKVLSSVYYTESRSRRYLVKQLAVNLALINKTRETMAIINALEPYQRRNALIDIAESIQQKGAPVENTFFYIDGFFKNTGSEKMYGMKIMKALAMIGTTRAQDMVAELIRDTPDLLKSRGMVNFIKGIISNDNSGIYYVATQYYLSSYISSTKELRLNNQILRYEVMKRMKNGEIDAADLLRYKFENTGNTWGDYEFGPNDPKNVELD